MDMNQLARIGANVRREQLMAELAMINAYLDEKKKPSFDNAGLEMKRIESFIVGRKKDVEVRGPRLAKIREVVKKKRRSMSPAARKAVSLRMKKYWALRRKAKAEKKKKS